MFAAHRLRGTTFSFLVILCATTLFGAEWDGPERELARKIAAVTGPGAVALEVTNRSSLDKTQVAEIERGLRARLSESGLAFVPPDQAAAMIEISLSEDLQKFVWVAQVHQGTNDPVVVMVSAPRGDAASSQPRAPALSVRKTPLYVQQPRILDAAVLDGNPAHLLLLDENGINVMRSQSNQWKTEQVLVIPHDKPWPRDLRGRIIPRKDHLFDAFLPGMLCQSSGSVPLAMNCRPTDDPWPLGEGQAVNAFFSSARNFFTGVLNPGIGKRTTAPPFYSVAALPRPNYTFWLLAGVDGRVHLLDGINDQASPSMTWGSDIAAVRSSCGSGAQVLATGNGSGPRDSVQAFEVADREAVGVSAAVEFPGKITALWTEASGTSAIAIAHNAQTGAYESYRLGIACGQ